jgi:hypothetical protein
MTSLGTDFETCAIWQGYIEDPAAKDFIARKALHYCFKRSAKNLTINLIHEFKNPLGIPHLSCTA